MPDMTAILTKKQKLLPDRVDEASVKALIERVTGKAEYAERFLIRRVEPKNPGYDRYRVFDEDGKIVIEATSGVAAANAFHIYLREICHCTYGPVTSAMNLPEILPAVGRVLENETKFLYRYCMNYVTYAYTCLYYKWEDYERLTDWMLLSGINLVMNPVGFEIVWRDFLISIGYSEKEAVENITDPAHMPWQWMGNMSEYGGNLPEWWFEEQKRMGNRITDKLRTFGAEVIYPGFCGKVPVNFREKYPLAHIYPQGDWCGAGERPAILSCNDPLFHTLGERFYEASVKHFGIGKFYSGDPFYEGGITDNIHLGTFARRMLDCAEKTNPDMVWFFQGWSGNPRESLFEYIREDEVLTAFLSGDRFYHGETTFGKSPWLYCSLFTFGGNLRLMGNLSGTLTGPWEGLRDERMVGTGIAIESIEMDEILFDAFAYTCIRSEKPSVEEYIDWYLQSRYGKTDENLHGAFSALEREVYTLFEGKAFKCSKNSTFCGDPCLTMHKVGFYESEDDTPYDIGVVREAARRLYAEYDALEENPCYRFDLMHLTRQCNADYGWVMVRKMEKAYMEKDLPEFETLSREYLELIDLQDRLLSNSERTMVGPWLQRAWDTGRTEREKRMFLHGAKDLITLWCGINGQYSLSHYSAREWSGLLGGYDRNRWDAYLSMLMLYIDKPQAIHEIDWTEYNYVFSFSNEQYPLEPGNTLREDVERSMEIWK